jgi:predicted small lipoprotein YifL
MHRLKLLILSVIVMLLATACGQKGPLYLPETEEPVKQLESEEPEEKESDGNGKNP